ncbi:protein OXIDATIVE STRESS 3 LIKE 1 [Humulus lupulus]|uniref:protein OXIDATIVE STRESS 3 LIKE 1 n=1 Tax=Humulus lupulus TaxID=3486 RepID=UPI002B414F4A|nr:protein OXIDATIVE STRESS 3 LIKE 1 [Humulus lupulus]
MSIALESSNRRLDLEPFGFARAGVVSCSSLFESATEEGRTAAEAEAEAGGVSFTTSSSPTSSSSSSIGKNSDVSQGSCTDEDDSEENEAQSSYKGPLQLMESLEDALPTRKGISSFYNGKSKSFTSLGDAVTASSITDIAKPENAYSKRRRNLLVFNHIWEKNRSSPQLRSYGSGISKRPISSSKSTLAFAVAAMSSSSENSGNTSDESSTSSFSRSPPPSSLPPLHPQSKASYNNSNNNNNNNSSSPTRMRRNVFSASSRSFSLADLRQ